MHNARKWKYSKRREEKIKKIRGPKSRVTKNILGQDIENVKWKRVEQ